MRNDSIDLPHPERLLAAGTGINRPANGLPRAERLAEIAQMRLLIRAQIDTELATTPTFLFIEPEPRARADLTVIASQLRGQSHILASPDPYRYQQLSDIWLIIVAVDEQGFDVVLHLGDIQRSFPHAMIIGRCGATARADRGRLFDSGITQLIGADELPTLLPALVTVIESERRTLPTRLERERLRAQVQDRLGSEGLLDVDLHPADDDCPSLEEMERELIMRALRLTRGSRAEAARKLCIPRRTLYRRLGAHGLDQYYLPQRRS